MKNDFNIIENDDFIIGFPDNVVSYCNFYIEHLAEDVETVSELEFVRDFILRMNYNIYDLIKISKNPMGDFTFKILSSEEDVLEGDGQDD